MSGYLSESETIESWSTGDTGNFDPDGFLIVTGRKDNIIVTERGAKYPSRVDRGDDHR